MKTNISINKSWIGWLDFGEEDQRRAKNYLRQFNADNTLDELGFGILRDSFADIFFPATNTIMTRTRYLVLIPALCVIVESEKLTGRAAESRLKELQDILRDALSKEERQDVIGTRSKEDIVRRPSSIYWSALRRLGIFLHREWGSSYYQNHLSEYYSAMATQIDDDGLSHISGQERSNWDKDFCRMLADGRSVLTTKGELPSTLNFGLTYSEALYLQMKYRQLAAAEGSSILSYLLEKTRVPKFNFPWEISLPPPLDQYVHHAQQFSMFVRGTTLQYYHLLQMQRKERGIEDNPTDFYEVFGLWWDATRQDLDSWSIEEFLITAEKLNALRRNDATFIKSWIGLNLAAKTPDTMLNNLQSQELIRQRERIIRPNKSRLRHPEYLQRWQPPKHTDLEAMKKYPDRLRYGLDYRAWIGSTFVQDISKGLKEMD